MACLFPKRNGLVNTKISIGTWRSNQRPIVDALNYDQSGRTITTLVFIGEARHVLMVKAPVLEPIDLGLILAGGFLERHNFTSRHERFGGRTP